MPAASITTTAGPAFEIPRGSWGYRIYNNSDTVLYVLENAPVTTSTGLPLRVGGERVVAFAERNQNPMTVQAVHGGSGSKNLRYEVLTVQMQALAGANEAATATLDASDIQIGAVEIKNGADDTRAKVGAVSGLAVGDNGLPVAARLFDIGEGDYETVAASQTDQVLGATGATGDYLSGLLIVPATTSPGAVSIKDGGGSAITVFTGGASSVSNLVPFFIPLGIKSGSGAWKVTTGANVSAIGVGNFA